MNKLERLDIRNTDISSGLEHLSDSVIYFCCQMDLRGSAGVREIFNLLDKQKKIEIIDDGGLINDGFIKDFPARLRAFKKGKGNSTNTHEAQIKQLKEQMEQLKKENAKLKTDLMYLVGSPQNFRKI